MAGNCEDLFVSENPIKRFIANSWHNKVLECIEHIPITDNLILDVGCGEGHITNLLIRNGYDTIGLDLSKERLAYNIPFIKGNIYRMPLKDNSYKTVIAVFVIEHLSNPKKALIECSRIAEDFVIIVVPNEPWFRLSNMIRLKYLSSWGNNPEHIQHYNQKTLYKLLKNVFDNITIKKGILSLYAICKVKK